MAESVIEQYKMAYHNNSIGYDSIVYYSIVYCSQCSKRANTGSLCSMPSRPIIELFNTVALWIGFLVVVIIFINWSTSWSSIIYYSFQPFNQLAIQNFDSCVVHKSLQSQGVAFPSNSTIIQTVLSLTSNKHRIPFFVISLYFNQFDECLFSLLLIE